MLEKFVFLHGLGQSCADWDKVLECFDGLGECHCPDLVKLCGSPSDYRGLYRAFSGYCTQLGGKPLNLVGLSLGGMLALNYAADNPGSVRSLVLIGTQYKSPKALLKLQNVMFRLMPGSSFKETGFNKEDFISLCRSMTELDFGASLGNIFCPVLVIIGDRDKPNRRAAFEMLHMINGARLTKIGSAGHEVNRDAPERLAKLIKRFYETEHIL